MKLFFCILLLLAGSVVYGQDADIVRAAMMLSGASGEEELDPSFVEMLEAFRGRAVNINGDRLSPSAILSPYQVAVIRDYRSRYGDILSWEELSLLEGFSKDFVDALKPFLSLYSSRMPGAADTVRTKAQAFARSTLTSAGGKAKLTGRMWRAGSAVRCSDNFSKWDGTFFGEASWHGHRILAGDYRLRFAEGLNLWTGFSMESLSSVDAFAKRSQGISPAWSFSSSGIQRGLAWEYSSTHWKGCAFASFDKTIGGRAEYLGRRFQAGLTAGILPLSLSADAKLNLRGTIISAEGAFRNKSFAAKAVLVSPFGEYWRLALQGRVIPSRYSGKKYGEYAFAAGTDYRGRRLRASLTADASFLPIPQKDPERFQLRVYGQLKWTPSSAWSAEARITERYRNYERPRTAVRLQARYSSGPWNANIRGEWVKCQEHGILGYVEGGYKNSAFQIWGRLTLFHAPKWDDRIYVYERDAPGSFLVPAYYGKGGSISVVGNWKHRFRFITLKAYARGAYTFKDGHVPAPVLNIQLAFEY